MDTPRKPMCSPNIDRKGRIIRAISGALFLGAGAFLHQFHWGFTAALALLAMLSFFEAARGWCLLRACRIRTPF